MAYKDTVPYFTPEEEEALRKATLEELSPPPGTPLSEEEWDEDNLGPYPGPEEAERLAREGYDSVPTTPDPLKKGQFDPDVEEYDPENISGIDTTEPEKKAPWMDKGEEYVPDETMLGLLMDVADPVRLMEWLAENHGPYGSDVPIVRELKKRGFKLPPGYEDYYNDEVSSIDYKNILDEKEYAELEKARADKNTHAIKVLEKRAKDRDKNTKARLKDQTKDDRDHKIRGNMAEAKRAEDQSKKGGETGEKPKRNTK